MLNTRRALTSRLVLIAALALALVPARAQFANPDGVAVIVGNRSYAGDIPGVDYAHRDAEAFRRYVVDVLGFDPENVIFLRDATQANMWSTFGNRATPERSELWSYLADDGSDVVVFYSGHGAPGLDDRRGYLLPVDADPNTAELNGYPIDLLYENLARLTEARTVRVYLDACFSGGSAGGGMLIEGASPVYVEASLPEATDERLSVLTAASGKQLASWDRKARHGLFTHHLLNALYGDGDRDGDGRVTAREAKAYLDRHMSRAAKRTWKRRQNASFAGDPEAVLAKAGAGGAFPPRPLLGEGTKPALESNERVEPARVTSGEDKEAALALTRGQRMLVQRGLASLEFDVGPADGRFGPRTRKAIAAYQLAKSEAATGYLSAEQTETLVGLGEEVVHRADDAEFARAKERNTTSSYEEYLARGGRHAAEARKLRAALSTKRRPDVAATAARSARKADPIRIAIHNWSSQMVGAQVLGKILAEAGFKAELIFSDSEAVYTSMCSGDVDLVHEVWQSAFSDAFENVVAQGCVLDITTHDARSREGWWYPAYVEEVCPGLPDWKALDVCHEHFSTPETAPRGRFLAPPAEWGKRYADRVESLGMRFEVVNASSASILWAELESASMRREPIVLFNWSPNFIEVNHEGKFIEFPEDEERYIKIGVWKEFPERNPEAFAIIEQVNFSNLDFAVMGKLVDVDGMEPEDAADKWLSDNEAKWRAWLR